MRGALISVLLGTVLVSAGLEYDPGRGGTTMEGPLTMNGAVTMTSGPMAVNGPLTAGPTVALNSATLSGTTSVTGACSFSQAPTGVARNGSLVRGSTLAITLIGCTSLGTASVAGATTKSSCKVTERPAPMPGLDCRVTAPGVVTVEVCAQVLGLGTAPAGTYWVSVTGE